MKIVLFDDNRVGVLTEQGFCDVTSVVPQHQSGFAANFWVRLCSNFEKVRPKIDAAVQKGESRPLDRVRLRSPVLNPTKVLAAASNYGSHVDEMRDRGIPSACRMSLGRFTTSPNWLLS
jgi:2-keto-4-pentenoate hydratase/2-oxohepta-3-ene-1,7-dioic acid hydratase in catechol pathway